jgi:hypothetical protein
VSRRITRNPTINARANGRAEHASHEDKKSMRYHIIATETRILARHPITAHKGGE